MFQKMKLFLKNEQGATAIEYAMIAAFIFLAIVTVLPLVGVSLRNAFQRVMDAFAA